MIKISSMALAVAMATEINRSFKADLKSNGINHNPRNNRKTKRKK